MTNNIEDTWHPGELAIQSRAGVKEKMSSIGPRLILDFMPDAHRNFFARLPMVIASSEDSSGRLWAVPLFGEPGFIRTPSPTVMAITVSVPHPLLSHLQVNCQVGLLGIEPESRRRSRVNGVITERTSDQVTIAVQQSFGNCPKYIRRRRMLANPCFGEISMEAFSSWDDYLFSFIASADTCFITSICPGNDGKHNRGIDVSHRGGDPGFIRFGQHQQILIPDYPGNNFFNTLGNLSIDSRAGLLFLDYSGGHIISLNGIAEVLWKTEEPALCSENSRVIQLTLETGYVIKNALPYLWTSMQSEDISR